MKRDGDLWLEFVNHDLCGLCGNTGILDTRPTAVSTVGVRSGVRQPCICPNGRAILKHAMALPSDRPRRKPKGE